MSDPSPDTPSPALAELGDLPRFLEDSARWHLIECFEQHGNGTSAVGYDPPLSCCSDAGAIPRLRAAAARLRKLDRIEAAIGDVWTADEIRWAVGDGRVVKMAYHPLDDMLRRLADALEVPDADT